MAIPRGAAHRAVAQGRKRITLRVKLARGGADAWRMQKVTVFGRKQENQPIDEAQQLAEVVGEQQFAAVEPFAERAVVGMLEETVAETEQCGFDAVSQAIAGGDSFLLTGLAPPLQRTIRRQRARVSEPACVKKQPERREVGEILFLEHRAEIRLDVRRAG